MKKIVNTLVLVAILAAVMIYMNASIQSPSFVELNANIEKEMQKLESASKDLFELQTNKRNFVIETLGESATENSAFNPETLNEQDIEKLIKNSSKKTDKIEQKIKEFDKKIYRKNQEIRQINQRIGKLKGKIEYNQLSEKSNAVEDWFTIAEGV